MESIARLGLFFITYFTLLCLTNIISYDIQYFQLSIFLVSSLIMSGWLYYLHFIKKSSPEFLREILYDFHRIVMRFHGFRGPRSQPFALSLIHI